MGEFVGVGDLLYLGVLNDEKSPFFGEVLVGLNAPSLSGDLGPEIDVGLPYFEF